MRPRYALLWSDYKKAITRIQIGEGSFRNFKTEAEAIETFRRIMQSPECLECKERIGLPSEWWDGHIGSQCEDRQLCFPCNFWTNIVTKDADGNGIVIDGFHWRDGGRKRVSDRLGKDRLGCAGAEWRIRMNDGRLIETNNLWGQGNIPAHFRDRLPDNAKNESKSGAKPSQKETS